MKNISTLVKDIYSVIQGEGGWDAAVSKHCGDRIAETLSSRLNPDEQQGHGGLRMSAMGSPCERKLWYNVNYTGSDKEDLPPFVRFKFLYGDILEDVVISLAKAAGHKVEGEQDQVEIAGIKGHRDCVIDGITVDIKSASTRAFDKFKSGALRSDDPFGYISQLSSYVYAGRFNEVESHPTMGAFLAVDKTTGHICLDVYDFTHEIETKVADFERIKLMVNEHKPPMRAFQPVPDGKSGNMKLPAACSYCSHKSECWPGLRSFAYSGGPRHLTRVVVEPNVKEIK